MSQQTFTPGGTQVAEPPAPVLPAGDSDNQADDNRRKLMLVGAGVGVLVLVIVAFFLLKGGGSSSADNFVIAHHTPKGAAAAPAQPPVVKLPKHVKVPVGRDPFKPLYTAPVAAAAGTTTATGTTAGTTSTTSSTGTTTTTTSSGSTTTAPTAAPTFHPVWVKLKAITATTASFDVGFSNGKTLKVVGYSAVKPAHAFAATFELLSVRNGVATLKYGDGSPFSLDRTHATMVVG